MPKHNCNCKNISTFELPPLNHHSHRSLVCPTVTATAVPIIKMATYIACESVRRFVRPLDDDCNLPGCVPHGLRNLPKPPQSYHT